MPTTITAGGASDSLALASGNDGLLTIQTGPSGAKVNALAFAADGTPTFLRGPLASMVRANTANGAGSTNTAIRRFTNATSQGTDITYADSVTLGGSFTINTSGVYSVTYSDSLNVSGDIGISLNSTQLNVNINNIAVADKVAAGVTGGAICNVAATLYLAAGAVIRAHIDPALTAGSRLSLFTITRVA